MTVQLVGVNLADSSLFSVRGVVDQDVNAPKALQ